MLVQSHDGAIHILPAVPDAWKTGKVTGLRTRGGYTVDVEWEDGALTGLTVYSALGGNCRLRLPETLVAADGSVKLRPARGENPNPYFCVPAVKKPLVSSEAPGVQTVPEKTVLVDFPAKAGATYRFVRK